MDVVDLSHWLHLVLPFGQKTQKFKNQIFQNGMSLRYPSMIIIQNLIEFGAHLHHFHGPSILEKDRLKDTKKK